jgi:ankyrin repeat protein
MLVQKGAKPYYPDFKGNYPIDLAAGQNHKNVVAYLIGVQVK